LLQRVIRLLDAAFVYWMLYGPACLPSVPRPANRPY
jgi:hypothetical protein